VHNTYKKVCNKVKSEIAKLSWEEQRIVSLECKTNTKKFWQYVNRKTTLRIGV